MVPLTELWLPILLSAVAVFFASSIIHMALPLHRKDFVRVPDEEAARAALRELDIPPGDYMIPCPEQYADMNSPETVKKFEEGPVALMTVSAAGTPAMGANLAQWFGFAAFVSMAAGYVAAIAYGPGADYMEVFRIVGTVAIMSYASAHAVQSIWMKRQWATSFRHMFDGVVYGLLTAGMFGWLWP